MVAKPKWVLVSAVLTRDELVIYEKEGDAKPQRRMSVAAVSKVSATSCQVRNGRAKSPYFAFIHYWDGSASVVGIF